MTACGPVAKTAGKSWQIKEEQTAQVVLPTAGLHFNGCYHPWHHKPKRSDQNSPKTHMIHLRWGALWNRSGFGTYKGDFNVNDVTLPMAKTCGLQEGSRREIRQQYEANFFIKIIKMAKNGTEHKQMLYWPGVCNSISTTSSSKELASLYIPSTKQGFSNLICQLTV